MSISIFTIVNYLLDIFTIVGILPPRNGRMKKWIPFYGYVLLTLVLILFVATYVMSFFHEDFVDILGRDFFLLTTAGSFIPTLLWLSVNGTVFWELRDLVNSEMFTKHKHQRHKKIIEKYSLQMRILVTSYLVFGTLFYIFIVSAPLLKNDRSGVFTGWFPFDRKKSPFYELVYLWHSLATVEVALSMSYVCLMTVGTCELHILCDMLLNIPYDEDAKEEIGKKDADYVYREIIKCAKQHVEISRYIKKFMEAFDVVITIHLSQFVIYVVQPVIQIMMSTTYTQIAFACLIICGSLFDTFLYCWFAWNVTYQSSQLNEAVIFSDWTNADKKVRQALCIILTNAQIPIQINAGGIVTMGMPTFVGILRTGYSVFAVFRARF